MLLREKIFLCETERSIIAKRFHNSSNKIYVYNIFKFLTYNILVKHSNTLIIRIWIHRNRYICDKNTQKSIYNINPWILLLYYVNKKIIINITWYFSPFEMNFWVFYICKYNANHTLFLSLTTITNVVIYYFLISPNILYWGTKKV